MTTTENKTMDICEIKSYLPHRYPLLLVDRVISYEEGKNITAIKNVTVNEEFFNGHFPHKPVMPGVLMIEAMAQTAALLSFKTMNLKPDENSVVYFVGIDNARFKRPVIPGDVLEIEVHFERQLRGISKFNCVARVADEVVAEATILCAMQSTGTK